MSLPRLLVLVVLAAVSAAAVALTPPDGTLDTTFGGQGIASWTAGGSVTLHDVATTGNLIIGVGQRRPAAGPPSHLHWQAIDRDGNLHATKSCSVPTNNLILGSAESEAYTAVVDSSGNLLVGGQIFALDSASQARPFLARFDLAANSCTLDTSFTGNGWEVYDDEYFCSAQDCAVVALAEIRPATTAVSAPRLVAIVRSSSGFLTSDFFLLGLHLDGTIDTSFGSFHGWRGIVMAHYPVDDSNFTSPIAMAIDPLGRILVLLTRFDPGGGFDTDVYLQRYTADGLPDDTFHNGYNELAISDGGPNDGVNTTARAVAVEENGNALVAYQNLAGSGAVIDIDLSNGHTNGGLVEEIAHPAAVAAQGNGRRLEVFDDDDDDGSRIVAMAEPSHGDPSFGPGASTDFDVDLGGDLPDAPEALRLWHGRPVIGGTATTSDGSKAGYLIRFANSYVFADGFDGGTTAFWSAARALAPPAP